MKKEILFINQSQFGYHIDYLNYCKFLKDDFSISYICWDYQRKRIEEENVNIIYISRNGNILKRNTRFIFAILRHLNDKVYFFIFINYFRGASLISLFSKKKQNLHIDLRSGSVSANPYVRYLYNSIVRFECQFYNSSSIISEGLKNMLKFNKNACILPLGASPVNLIKNCNHRVHLLYIGTFTNRRIEDTIIGLNVFLEDNPKADIHYTIIGNGWYNEIENLKALVNELGLNKFIDLPGYISNVELSSFFEITNVGVSYVPITPYYEYQPPTKTFEYLMAGMPIIATNTYENRQVVNIENGVLITDTPKNFANGIKTIYQNIDQYSSQKIRKSVEQYDWEIIVRTIKEKIIKNNQIEIF